MKNCHSSVPFSSVLSFLPSTTKLQKGNVFTCVCHSVHKAGGCLPQCMLGYTSPLGRHTLMRRHPSGQTPPPPQQTATAAGGMHPTGMHSCCYLKIFCIVYIWLVGQCFNCLWQYCACKIENHVLQELRYH